MATIDIREEQDNNVDEIVFWSAIADDETVLAYCLEMPSKRVTISDEHDYVYIENKQHAQNLIKALNKAIELGWLK